MKTLTILSISLAFLTPLTAQGDQGSQGFVLKAGDHDIAQVIESSATFLGRNHILAATEMAGIQDPTVRLQKTLNLDVQGCEEVVSQLAYMKGLLMTPVDVNRGIYEFINLRGPRRGDIRPVFMTPEDVIKRARLKVRVLTSVRLQHINAQLAANGLRPLLAQNSNSGQMTIASMSSASLMFQGTADEVAVAVQMVTSMDTPGAEAINGQPMQRLAAVEQELQATRQKLAALEKQLGGKDK